LKFVSDESVDSLITQILRENQFQVISISESNSGESDDRVLEIAVQENAILITEDKDFGELVFRLQKKNQGVILIRLSGLPSERKASIVLRAIQENLNQMHFAFTIIEYNFVRIRKPF
jgi:predicted nuclease of predicted toxin-antitoxin system